MGGEAPSLGGNKDQEIFYQNSILEFDSLNTIQEIALLMQGKKFSFINDGESSFLINLLDSANEVLSSFPVYSGESLTDISLNSFVSKIQIENVDQDSCSCRLFVEEVLVNADNQADCKPIK